MIARLLLVLLLAGLALPATATMPCHDGAPPPMAGMTHHAPATSDVPTTPAKAMPAHLCIGCVPPSSWRAGTIAAPLLPPMTLGGRPLRALIAGPPLAPEPPPPRLA
ncbi:hypothetical protein DFR49_3491 [Hephaestia caeni]|uniref:DUF2946 family protein n=1 Tax=Hephaestia caeni TaxID=645617 RepID=A0A397NV56_9SPHN|nr:hypothetical protein [Hephaestia caeni]RIA37604.1 hypothetical protein DFR49_3491 [Hephaestia caeni]